MTPATYDGLFLFGPAHTVSARLNPVERWWTAYPGVHGRQTQTGGSRGASADARMTLVADNEALLAVIVNVWETYKAQGGGYILTDTYGVPWPAMIVIDFQPASEIFADGDGVAREFVAHFESTF